MENLNKIKTVKNGTVSLVTILSQDYDSFIQQLVKITTKNQLIFVSATNKYTQFKKIISDKKICFVDTLTRLMGPRAKGEECAIYIDSPSDLPGISEQLSTFLENKKDCLILFDSISSFLLYNKPEDFMQFINFVSQEIKNADSKCLVLNLNGEVDASVMKKISVYCDNQIDLNGNYFI